MSIRRRIRASACAPLVAVLLPLCAPTHVAGQTFTGIGPVAPFVLPAQADPNLRHVPARSRPAPVSSLDLRPTQSIAKPATPAPVPQVVLSPRPAVERQQAATAANDHASEAVLRHFPNLLGGFRVIGEDGVLEWPVYVTDAEAADHVRLRIGYLTAVSDAPEGSALVATVNDVKVGEATLEAPNAVRVVEMEVPAGVLKGGINAVRFSVAQRHRVDCSVAATYELWTQIDPSQTGIVIPRRSTGIADVRDLAAVSPDAAGAYPIRIVTTSKPDAKQMQRIFRAVQALSLAGRFEQPIVDFGAPAKGPHGLNLAIGTPADLAKLHLGVPFGSTLGADVTVRPATADAAVMLVLAGATDEDVDHAVAQLKALGRSQSKGTASGLRAARAASGRQVEGGERIKLSELGLVSQEFSGRLFRTAFNVVMPPDFLPADYAKATLELAGGYAPGLLPGSQVLIHINGKAVASDRLPKSSGDVFKQKQIPLLLGYWQAGVNHIEIFAELPKAADAACESAQSGDATKRFLFLDDTTLSIPRFARVGHLPELAASVGGGLPFTAVTRVPKLYIPVPDRPTVSAAATLVARMAVSSRQAVDFEFTSQPPAPGAGATLVVAPARTLDKTLLAALGIDPAALRQAWEERSKAPLIKDGRLAWADAPDAAAALQRDEPMACRVPRWLGRPVPVAGAAPLPDAPSGPVEHADLFDKWNDDLNARTGWLGWAAGGVARAVDWTLGTVKTSAQWTVGRFSASPTSEVIKPQHSLVVAQTAHGGSLDDVVTLVTAPNAALLDASMRCLTDPRVWTRIGGRMSALDGSTGALAQVAAEKLTYVATAPLSLENVRLIAAGWLSNNPILYVVLILLIAICLGITTTRVVQNTGRRQP